MYTVYQHKNKINGKIYFGITSRNPIEQWGNNGSNYKSTPHFYSAIQKYGWDNFEHNILYENLTKEEACDIEKTLIREYNTQDREFGYNILEGGQASTLPTEVREKMSQAMMGNQNGAGHPCSEEKKKILSQSYPNKRRVYCDETETIYPSVQGCARELHLHATLVSKVCQGKLHTTGGYHLHYYDDMINA